MDSAEYKIYVAIFLLILCIISFFIVVYITSLEPVGEMYTIKLSCNHNNVPLTIYRKNTMFAYKGLILHNGINEFQLPEGTYRFKVDNFYTGYSTLNWDSVIVVNSDQVIQFGR